MSAEAGTTGREEKQERQGEGDGEQVHKCTRWQSPAATNEGVPRAMYQADKYA